MPLKLDYHISIRNIRGEKDDNIANCYGQKCKNIDNAQQRAICKEECHQSVLGDTISKLSGVVSKCNFADKPSACRQAIARMIRIYRDRIQTSKGRQRDAKSELLAANAIKRRK